MLEKWQEFKFKYNAFCSTKYDFGIWSSLAYDYCKTSLSNDINICINDLSDFR